MDLGIPLDFFFLYAWVHKGHVFCPWGVTYITAQQGPVGWRLLPNVYQMTLCVEHLQPTWGILRFFDDKISARYNKYRVFVRVILAFGPELEL